MALPLEPPEPPKLHPLSDWERAIADYRSIGMTLDEHPMGLMREDLDPEILRSNELELAQNGDFVEVAGMVVARQRPETANGIVFMLLEDETGTVNLVVPPPVYAECRAAVRAATVVRARGRLERHEGTTNVVVTEVVVLSIPAASARRGTNRGKAGPGQVEDKPSAARSRRSRQRGDRPIRERAVAELRAVAPRGHSWGQRR